MIQTNAQSNSEIHEGRPARTQGDEPRAEVSPERA
jgi:hypothetical protein